MLPLLAGIEGTALSERESALFSRLQPAGYILFSRNMQDPEETRELTDSLRRLSTGPHSPIIAVDQEGGRVVRTADFGLPFPSAASLAATRDTHLIEQAALMTARCLFSLGINTDLAPVLDLSSPRTNALGGRCWGADTQDVISYAGLWNRVLSRRGIMTCGKHFPGMGAAQCDPHFTLPAIATSRAAFLDDGAATPFTALMPELPSIMVAHVQATGLDAQLPSSLSPVVVQDFLRNQLGYEGVVFTDDLCMGAITSLYAPEQAARLALLAGCDAPLICHHAADLLDSAAEALRDVPPQILQRAEERLEHFRMLIPDALPPMSFLAHRNFARQLQEFCSRIPEPTANVASSPVHHM